MLTDAPPRKPNLKFFEDSDRLKNIPLPEDDRLVKIAGSIEVAMKTGETNSVRQVCDDFVEAACEFYHIPRCTIRVLAARPLWVREHSTGELFGDYQPD